MSAELLLKGFTREIQELISQGVTIDLQLTPNQAMALIAMVQLACRHHGYGGHSRAVAIDIVQDMNSQFTSHRVPSIVEVIRRGWQPQYDVSKDDD